ncbi:HK97-gp10 family putative phage morphogenesis protein [Heyndrickxia oleronia]|uniref:HK97-gp10 family putative phage morphogenesis protein n=1 Tax=Heyndrickxia oleronia TaxID=38875 RepID=UPI001C0EC693|nr:HK97-gp10 family putative phage morphogenesis protein [Heyndrickxia oleronia]MBU5214563.1 HK97 gp10 family phage protein [Heyndrickxia oleronia]
MARKMKQNSRMRLKVEGVDDVLKALQQANAEIEKELRDLVSEAAEIVFREADSRVPIKSGKSRHTLRIEIGEDKNGNFYANVVIGNGTGKEDPFYIVFYELGTSRQPPRPFMRPSLDKSKTKIRKLLVEGLRRIVESQGK